MSTDAGQNGEDKSPRADERMCKWGMIFLVLSWGFNYFFDEPSPWVYVGFAFALVGCVLAVIYCVQTVKEIRYKKRRDQHEVSNTDSDI